MHLTAILERVACVVFELRTLTLKMDVTQKRAVAWGSFDGYHGNCTEFKCVSVVCMCVRLCRSPGTKRHPVSKQCVQFFLTVKFFVCECSCALCLCLSSPGQSTPRRRPAAPCRWGCTWLSSPWRPRALSRSGAWWLGTVCTRARLQSPGTHTHKQTQNTHKAL